LPCVAFPQETPAVSAPPEFTFTVDKSQRMSPATGAPYSAHEVHEVQMPSGDGALIPQATTILHVYRDSQGRTRKDRPVPGSEFIIVEIQDPVARCEYVLDPQRRIAHRLKQPLFEIYDAHKAGAKTGALKPAAPGAVPDGYESLGTRMIEGVMAEGTRQTLNIPSSSRKHRHRGPFKANLEVWNSPELEVRVLTKSSDNRTRGDTVIRLTHISRSEPDPALFQVPTGYTVVDESDTFSIVITRP
jgi:hypothetical protein